MRAGGAEAFGIAGIDVDGGARPAFPGAGLGTVQDAFAAQKDGGAFVNLTSDQDATLIGATSSVSEKVELHTMKMEGEKMVMAQVPSIPLPANTKVELKPGSLHIMFMSLKAPLKEGDTVTLKLEIKNKAGKSEFLDLQAPVKALGEAMPMKMSH